MLLEVDDLHLAFTQPGAHGRPRTTPVLNGVTFDLPAGEILGLVGESGSGKSQTVNAIMRLLPRGATLVSGAIRFEGQDLATLSPAALDRLRGNRITMITQSPHAGLDPLARVGDQLIRVRRTHRSDTRGTAHAAALDMLARVGIPDPARRMRAWPHELSGGMAQRIMIAMALLNEPHLIIADEPTTGLDATVQMQVLDEFRAAVRSRGLGAILVTHDLGVVARYCDRVAVMFAGATIERAPVAALYRRPAHPYTIALLAAARSGAGAGGPPLGLSPGPSPGCLYRQRCPAATAVCAERPILRDVGAGRAVACHHAD